LEQKGHCNVGAKVFLSGAGLARYFLRAFEGPLFSSSYSSKPLYISSFTLIGFSLAPNP